MKKILIGGSFLIAVLSFSACSTQSTSQTGQTNQTDQNTVTANQKAGTTTKSGKVTQAGKAYVLQSGAQSIGIDSYSVDLSQYVGQQITVSGEYSGDTLFVTQVISH